MQVVLQLFGAFRDYGNELVLSVPDGASIANVRLATQEQLPDASALIALSRFASDTALLEETASAPATLAIIPPVSGG